MKNLIIENAKLLDEEGQLTTSKKILVKDGIIQEIIEMDENPAATSLNEDAETLDFNHKLAISGFIDGHTHICQQLLRGRVSDEYPMIWTRFLIPFESQLTPDQVKIGADLACLEMIKAGITSFADPGGVHMAEVANAVLESGMRAVLTRSSMDIKDTYNENLVEDIDTLLTNTQDLYSKYDGKDGRLDIYFGLRQLMNCSPELVRETVKLADQLDTGIHMHLCEHKDEVKYCLVNYEMRPVEFLEKNGALGPNLITAHNVLYTSHDIKTLSEYDVKVVHCPTANLSNHGFPKVTEILEAGLNVGLGCDGGSNVPLDLFNEMRVLKYGTQAFWGLPVFDPKVLVNRQLLEMSTQGGATTLGKGDELGSIEVGKKADIISIDISSPRYISHNTLNSLIMTGNSHDVNDVVIDGKIVMKDRNVQTLNEEQVLKNARELTPHLVTG